MNCHIGGSKVSLMNDEDVFEDSSIFNNLEDSLLSINKKTNNTSLNKVSESFNNSDLNVSALCCDEEIKGYDKLTGKTWIYPTNYPVRDYQYNIIKAAILKNTLVSLPTGLGKTFIAAVIMYNFYRWYPLGKIVFTAPTRPLVAQQIEACYNICALPSDDTVEMTGTLQVNTRKIHWKNKRVFFATPQVIFNDIQSGICPGDQIRCLVFDEAHRARGNYAYCQIISTLSQMGHKTFRILALSATPGGKLEDVINVVKNLHIAHLELRTENCIDVAPYSHVRKINTVVIQLGPELTWLRDQYVEILDIYARRLKQLNILPHNVGNLSKGRVVMLYKEFQTKDRVLRHPQHNYIMKDFTILISLYHGLELLVKHGSRVFLNFFDEHPEKSWIQCNDQLVALLERLRDDLGINPLSLDRSILPDGTIPEIPQNIHFGHPKFYRLKEIMLEHFKRSKDKGQDTRAMVFCEYRESVNLVHCLLLQCRPLIVPQMFVGQGASGKDGKTLVSQTHQLRVMNNFRQGSCNTLVATCVAEEGLDVGNVDLIICFDISTRSPVRLVQRCGRTGRERGGQVHILVTEGREHQTLLDCMRQRDGLNKKILHSKEIENNLYKANMRMLPHDHTPEIQKMFITVAKKEDPKEKLKNQTKNKEKVQNTLKNMFSKSSRRSSSKDAPHDSSISKQQFEELYPHGYTDSSFFPDRKEYVMCNKETILQQKQHESNSNKQSNSWLEWQRSLQSTVNIGHSSDATILSEILKYSDAKRFELPQSKQNPSYNTLMLSTQKMQLKSPIKPKHIKKKQKMSPVKKDGDIRALFSSAIRATKSYSKVINDLGLQHEDNVPTILLDLLFEFNSKNSYDSKCMLCENVINCRLISNLKDNNLKTPLTSLADIKYPDINLLDEINADSIQEYITSKRSKKLAENASLFIDEDINLLNDIVISNVSNEHPQTNINNSANFDLDFEFDSSDPKIVHSSDNKFNIGNIEDIFDSSSPEEVAPQIDKNISAPKETLDFFGLNSLDDIFIDSDNSELCEIDNEINKSENNSVRNISLSPSILPGSQRKHNNVCKNKIMKYSTSLESEMKPKIFQDLSKNERQFIESTSKICLQSNEIDDTVNKNVSATSKCRSMFTVTQLVDMINNSNNENSTEALKNTSLINSNEINFFNNFGEDRSKSPILLTQADKKNNSMNKPMMQNVIILDSDSDSTIDYSPQTHKERPQDVNLESPVCDERKYPKDDNVTYLSPRLNKKMPQDINLRSLVRYERKNISDDNVTVLSPRINKNMPQDVNSESPVCNKRKNPEDDDITGSPYFCKKVKPNHTTNSFIEKYKDMLSLKNNIKENNVNRMHHTLSPFLLTQKENINHTSIIDNKTESLISKDKVKLKDLNVFRRASKTFNHSEFKPKPTLKETKNLIISQSNNESQYLSDDDFKDLNTFNKRKIVEDSSPIIRKKKRRKVNEFLDLEAEISDCQSGDELSDDSVGSIVNFICDEEHLSQDDMHARYLHSVKSPVKGGFKLPPLPQLTSDMLSQAVDEDDSYEMDSFCVDTFVGLTQVHDMTALERAELKLEAQRKRKGKHRKQKQKIKSETDHDVSADSPLIIKKKKNHKRKIDSDSDDGG